MRPSSQDLHPSSGARFVFEREGEGADAGYRVSIHLADGRTFFAALSWVDGHARLEPEPDGDEALVWAHSETLKLARTLKHSPKPHMVRWRG